MMLYETTPTEFDFDCIATKNDAYTNFSVDVNETIQEVVQKKDSQVVSRRVVNHPVWRNNIVPVVLTQHTSRIVSGSLLASFTLIMVLSQVTSSVAVHWAFGVPLVLWNLILIGFAVALERPVTVRTKRYVKRTSSGDVLHQSVWLPTPQQFDERVREYYKQALKRYVEEVALGVVRSRLQVTTEDCQLPLRSAIQQAVYSDDDDIAVGESED